MKFHRFVKFHCTCASVRDGPGIRGSGTSPTKVERVSHSNSNATGMNKNGLCHSAHEASEVNVSKIIVSLTFNINSGTRSTHDWFGSGTQQLYEILRFQCRVGHSVHSPHWGHGQYEPNHS